MNTKNATVLYLGPSMLTGAPIVVLASLESGNVKTGPLIQTWIFAADQAPMAASKAGADDAMCGSCPRRHSLGGTCYVRLDGFSGTHSVWNRWDKEGRPGPNWDDPRTIIALQTEAMTHGIRLGAYGDPAAVPFHIWEDFLAAIQPRVVTGYTHQWREAHAAPLRTLVMASCDSAADARDAHAAGWRYFAAIPADDTRERAALPGPVVNCLSDAKGIQCRTCGICDGARAEREVQPASVWIADHGTKAISKANKARRSLALAVVTV